MATAPRCVRTDGRSWRCKRPAVEGGGGYCEAHIRRKGKGKVAVEGSGGRGPVGPRKSRRLSLKMVKGGVKGDVGGAQEEVMETRAGDLKGNDVEKVYVRRPKLVSMEGSTPEKVYMRRRKRDYSEISEGIVSPTSVSMSTPLQKCAIRTRSNLENPKKNPLRNRGYMEVDGYKMENEAFQALGDGKDQKENITEGGKDLKMNDIKKEKESAGDAAVAPFSAPMSPNIGESAHQQSLFTQTQLDFNNDLPAPSASTSSMAIKKRDGTQSKNGDTRLGNLDIGSGVKPQNAKQVSKSIDEFSVSKCAALLNNMTGFTPEELVKASKLFIKSFNREMFLSLKDELRRVWLRSQISD